MNSKILLDENKQYKFDFSNAKYVLDLHELANSLMVNDVDFITEIDDQVLFIEYKNAEVSNAVNPDAMFEKINTDKFISNISKKYYDSLLLFWGTGNDKSESKIKYILIIQHPKIDLRVRKQLRNKIREKLPMLRKDKRIIKGFISEFEVYNLNEWEEKFNNIKISKVES